MNEVQINAAQYFGQTDTDITEEFYDSEDDDEICSPYIGSKAAVQPYDDDEFSLRPRDSFSVIAEAMPYVSNIVVPALPLPSNQLTGNRVTFESNALLEGLPAMPAMHTPRVNLDQLNSEFSIPQLASPRSSDMEISFGVPQMASPRFDPIAEETAEEEWDRLHHLKSVPLHPVQFAVNTTILEEEEEEEWGEELTDSEEATPRFVPEMDQWAGESPAAPLSSTPRFVPAMLMAQTNFADGVFQVEQDSITDQFYDTEELSDSSDDEEIERVN